MADYGIKVSQIGKDITSTNVNDYVIHSGYYIPKTYLVGSASLSFANETDTHSNKTIVTVNHNLGYRPYCTFFWNKNNTTYSGDIWIEFQGGSHICIEDIAMYVDTTKFQLFYQYSTGGDGLTGISSYVFNFKYYIFIDRGEI